MLPTDWRLLLGLCCLLCRTYAYPHDTIAPRLDKFVFGAIGDSWGSGVQWSNDTAYDENKDGCMRYKYAWSTVVNSKYSSWTPSGNQESQFEFVACSGAHLENMDEQMDEMTRPKLVLMEAGGNNADFYPMADACLFHANPTTPYGKNYENDNSENPEGSCRKEIKLVRERLEGDKMQRQVVQAIHKWRSHKAVKDNDATLMLLGYGRFFAMNTECDRRTFNVVWGSSPQQLVRAMRDEFNELVSFMNQAIRSAAESFNDPKIQYIDIDPAFEGHRFCEEGHSKFDDLNWSDKVWIWNSPAKFLITIKAGDKTEDYTDRAAPKEIVDSLINHIVGRWTEGDLIVWRFKNPENPSIEMELRAPIDGSSSNGDLGGKVARTLHPTEKGHNAMGEIVAQKLASHYGRGR